MPKFAYRTRGQSSPQGKPKVYFCCHKEDFAPFFETISQEILELQNCAVWYDEEPEAPYEEESLLLDLSQMQLFVIPVTSRFLYQPCRAREVEFAYAFSHHIPVLPLMQESGLENAFNKICGDLQCLNKYDTDPTAIPYAEKLKNFLNSVLIGDEMAEKIRAAFDAYVFLSYRKKDRKYAQQLMRLIHENEFCRDIAIWYDEFLTPGENFNDSIKDALEKSKLFTLVVTPNLVNETNYVMTIEYPMALKEQKTVLPVELSPTDRQALKEKYEGIPDCTDSKDKEALSAAFLKAVQAMAIRENDSSPEHLFFIGLAYLGGVDVEVDHERAAALITSAADAGLPEAVGKLVNMYQNGETVPRDWNQVLFWQRKLADIYRRKYAETGEKEAERALFYALWHLGEWEQDRGLFADAESAFLEMYRISEENLERTKKTGYLRNLSVSCDLLGSAAEVCGDTENAVKWYEEALKAREIVLEKTSDPELAKRDLCVSYDKMGNFARDRGNLDEAETWYRKSFCLRKEMAEKNPSLQNRRNLTYCYHLLGDIEKERGNYTKAEEWYIKRTDLCSQLVEEENTDDLRYELSISYALLGLISENRIHYAEACAYYEQALFLKKELAEKQGTIQSLYDVSDLNIRLGNVLRQSGDYKEGRKRYEESLAVLEEIRKEIDTPQIYLELNDCYLFSGNLAEEEGNFDEAGAWYEKGRLISESLMKENPTVQAKRALLKVYKQFGGLELRMDRSAGVKKWYEKTLILSEDLSEETGAVSDRRELILCYMFFAKAAMDMGEIREAEEWLMKNLAVSRSLAEETGTVREWEAVADTYDWLAETAKTEGNKTAAKEWLEKSLTVYEKLAEETQRGDIYAAWAWVLYRFGVADQENTDWDAVRQAQDIFQELTEKYPDEADYKKKLIAVILTGINAPALSSEKGGEEDEWEWDDWEDNE